MKTRHVLNAFAVSLHVFALVGMQACTDNENPGNSSDTSTNADTNTDSDTDSDTAAGNDSDPNADTNVATDADTDSVTDTVTDTGTSIADTGTSVPDTDTSVADTDTSVADTDTGAKLVFGYPVYTQKEIDSWSVSSAEYTRLANSWAGNVNRAHSTWGTEISSVERDVLKDESVYIKVQAVLWAADGKEERRAKVAAMLDELGSVTSWQWDSVEQYRLVAGWACTNLAQAAAITGYTNSAFTTFLVDVCYPILDWTNGPNWHASFADSRLAIAAYVGDTALWKDATAYFYNRIGQSIYHSLYDNGKVLPLLNNVGTPLVSLTVTHWGGAWGAGQINSDFTPVDPAQFPNGVNAERMRDLGHVSMGLGAFTHAARTILAQGETLAPHAYDRLREAYAHHGYRVLTYINTGTIPAPDTMKGDGGGALNQAWFGARKLFGADTPADVVALCNHANVTSYAAAGANHLTAEAFTDEY